ncbi:MULTISPECIES: argininosuccinate lyase [Breznakia]|uniref:Argininosuccinate lyase n=1 Tax=Breznakia blatticola TaxID=1754012 RepID=A0A4R8A5W4_9FIRM|nr:MULTISPECIES: argininosuccinate lyase [Breznakia]MDH6366179.1 argininosuccinate lyase [Breznakia sp. PH1-1]MDH6403272.1 argininosuccinate lyase [Breznakia sp. PF1-11]MDH6410981.1 argininosuccinate lyase [Breznakia sp. PFB1-11]MDH6413345.1 argininosuccinate lyase [Breznakia sp. PFB1-14]MDH6416110.1 argininosuccinate lyase [Breznakia sp. PFB1-4]
MKLWGARFTKEASKKLNDFNSSIQVDCRMYKQDIKGSIAHVTMLAKQDIIPEEDAKTIVEALQDIEKDIDEGTLMIDPEAEDIHMFIEQVLTQRTGDVGKKLHTGRSRNDQVALDFRLYTMDRLDDLTTLVKELILTLCKQAEKHTETIMPGYTHLQRAQPITFAHHLLAYVEMLTRDLQRFAFAKEQANVSPLGSGALATTTYPIDRAYSAKLLGMKDISLNSLDGVSDRDFAIDAANAVATCMMHLSRFSEEIVLWSSWEFKFIELDDAFATGSSIMPQKKNPDICELIRGKTGRTYGNLMNLLTMMKGLALAYNKDMQEDKEALFDSLDTLEVCLETVIPMVDTMQVLKENMRSAAAKGFINATDCADYLTKKGMPFRDAYGVIGKLVQQAITSNKVLEELHLEEFQEVSELFEEDIYEAISLDTCVNKRSVVGGPAPAATKAHIALVVQELGDQNE